MNKFQLGLMFVFGAIALVAILVFAGVIPIGGSSNQVGEKIVMWGTLPQNSIAELIGEFNENNKTLFNLEYIEKDSETYESELIDALASGYNPDLWIIDQGMANKFSDKVYIIPFETIDQRTLLDTYIDGSKVFLTDTGSVAIPLTVDPMVLYWNKSLFANAGLTAPPKTWDDFLVYAQKLTIFDENQNIAQAGAGIGETNIKNFKDIFSMLVLQAGNNIVDTKTRKVILGEKREDETEGAGISVLKFFTQFSNPKKSSYTWNISLPDSFSMFTAGNLAMYFGFVSDFQKISDANPHLIFDVTAVPQIKNTKFYATFGNINGLVVSKYSGSAKIGAALAAVFKMTEPEFLSAFSQQLNLVPARKDLLSATTNDLYTPIFYKSAIQSFGWYDPDPKKTREIFKEMITSVTSGKTGADNAISNASDKINNLIKR